MGTSQVTSATFSRPPAVVTVHTQQQTASDPKRSRLQGLSSVELTSHLKRLFGELEAMSLDLADHLHRKEFLSGRHRSLQYMAVQLAHGRGMSGVCWCAPGVFRGGGGLRRIGALCGRFGILSCIVCYAEWCVVCTWCGSGRGMNWGVLGALCGFFAILCISSCIVC